MNLTDAQRLIVNLTNNRTPESDPWTLRATRLLVALIPVLAWPHPGALRGNSESLLDIEQLIARANLRTERFADVAWQGVRTYLASLPGMTMTVSGEIATAGTVSFESVREHHEYVLMQLGHVSG